MMPDLKVVIGGRNFNISCNPGEESAAQESANFLDQEAELLQAQLGRLPEDKMLLMSGLLLGDKIRVLKHEQIALEETLRVTQAKLNELRSKYDSDSILSAETSQKLVDNSLRDSIEEEALTAIQNISDMLDDLISNVNISYSKK
jgi:cell division protein ZapA